MCWRLCLLLALASASRLQQRLLADDDLAEVQDFVPTIPKGLPTARLKVQPGVGVPFGADPANPKAWRFSLFRQVRHGHLTTTWQGFDSQRLREVELVQYGERGFEDLEKSKEECRQLQKLIASDSSYLPGKEHICQCLESGFSSFDGPYLVMEDCGETLQERLRKQWREPDPDFLQNARRWIRGGLEAVRFLSGLKAPNPPMSHFNVHANSLMIDSSGELKLVDFSNAKASKDWQKPWCNDLANFGAVFYNLLCRRRAADPAFSLEVMALGGSACLDGTLGIATAQDWKAMRAALACEPVEEVIRLLDEAR